MKVRSDGWTINFFGMRKMQTTHSNGFRASSKNYGKKRAVYLRPMPKQNRFCVYSENDERQVNRMNKVPKCRECDDYRVSEPLDHFFQTETCATKHYCCNPQAFTDGEQFLKYIPRDEMDGNSPNWCPLREAGEVSDG